MRGSSQKPFQSIFLEHPSRREGFASPSGLATDYVSLQGTLPAPPAYSGFCQQGKLSPHWFVLRRRILFCLLLPSPCYIWHLNSCIQRMEGQAWWGNIRLLYSHSTFFPYDNFKHEKSSCACTACLFQEIPHWVLKKICISLLLSVLQKAWRQLAKTIPKSKHFAGKPRQLDPREAASVGKNLQWGKPGWTQILTDHFVLQKKNKQTTFPL